MATESDKTSTGVIATIVIVGSLATVAISVMVAAMVRAEDTDLERARPRHADLETVAALDRQQFARLNAKPSWVAEPGGKVAIPIERAMQVVVEEYRKKPEAASPPPPPGLVMDPVPSTAAAPAGSPQGTPPAAVTPVVGAAPTGAAPAPAAAPGASPAAAPVPAPVGGP